MVERLVDSLLECPEVGQIILTCNISETLNLADDARLAVIENRIPKGFGANHNAAFTRCEQPFFCPLNPDIELLCNPFPVLLQAASATDASLMTPLVISPEGNVEDSIRHFPTLSSLAVKALGGGDGRYEVKAGECDFCPEWVAGMFMLFRREAFQRLGGFDEGFFLYYEDVDICVRAWKQGMLIVACPGISVVHDARRDSRRSFRHLRWHLASMGRFFFKHWGRLPTANVFKL